MKKISLVLCVCAMAFAGFLASCKNNTMSGDYIEDTYVYSDYYYNVSGSLSEVETVGATSTTTSYAVLKGTGNVWWNANNQVSGDAPSTSNNWSNDLNASVDRENNYGLSVNGRADRTVTTTAGSTKTYNVSWYIPNPVSVLYKFGDDFYVKTIKGDYTKVSLTGAFGDEEFTLKYDYTIDNSTTAAVNKTQYTGELKFKKPSKAD